MIGKMPPAYKTYLDIPSYFRGETQDERNHRMLKTTARTIQPHVQHWTKYDNTWNDFDVYRALKESTNGPTPSDSGFDTPYKNPSLSR